MARGEELPLLSSSMEISSDDIVGGCDMQSMASSASTIKTGHPLKRSAPQHSNDADQPSGNDTNSAAGAGSPRHHHHGTGTILETALNSAKTCMGTGTLALPYAASQGGYIFNLLGLLLISIWNLWSVNRLIECGEMVDELHGAAINANGGNVEGRGTRGQGQQQQPARRASRTSRHRRTGSSMRKLYRDMMTDGVDIVEEEVQWSEENVMAETQSPPEGTSTYGKVAWHALGPIGLHIMDAALLVLLLGVVIAYQDAIISFVRETPLTTGSAAFDSLWTVLIIAPLSCVQDLHFLSKTSALGIFIIFISFAVIFGYGFIENGFSGIFEVSWDDMWPTNLTGVCNWFGVTVFGFGAVPITFNLQESMRDPSGMSRATEIALILVGGTYAIIGNGVAILFKPAEPEFEGDVLQELPVSWIPTMVRLAMTIVLTITAPILLIPCAELIEGKFGLTEESFSKPHYRILIRFALAFFCAGIAFIVPEFVHVISFIGAFCVVLTSFIFPPSLHLALIRQRLSEREGVRLFKRSNKELGRFEKQEDDIERKWQRMVRVDAVLCVLGTIVSLVASVLTFIDLTAQSKLD